MSNHFIKTESEIELMRHGGEILKKAHQDVKEAIAPGVSLQQLDLIAERVIREHGAEPGFKGYQGFPATLCTMLNSEVVHGIPDQRTLKAGDLLSVDCGVLWKGYYADAAFTVIVGGDDTHPERAKFSNCVYEALQKGCNAAIAGNTIGDIGHAIQTYVEKSGYHVCREYTGHGLGTQLHEDPSVYNYGKPGKGPRLHEGMTLAIEPIITAGSPKTKTLSDGWTVVTLDGRDACQWEHFGVVRKNKFEVLA